MVTAPHPRAGLEKRILGEGGKDMWVPTHHATLPPPPPGVQ